MLLLSAAYQELKEVTRPQPFKIKWRITDIAAKLQEAAHEIKRYSSPRFDVFFQDTRKLYIQCNIEGNKLGLFLGQDVQESDENSSLDIGGTSFTVTKEGLPDKKCSFNIVQILCLPTHMWGLPSFLADIRPYIDNNCINVTLHLMRHKDNESLVL